MKMKKRTKICIYNQYSSYIDIYMFKCLYQIQGKV